MCKILFWFLNFTKKFVLVLKLKKILFSSLNFVKCFFNNLETKITMKKEFFLTV